MAWSRSTHVAEGIDGGSADLEREFAEHFLPRLRAFFRARTASADWVEDLTQETILAALLSTGAGRLRELDSLEAFVLGIARNQLAEAVRQKVQGPPAPLEIEIELVRGAPMLAPEWILAVRAEFDGLDEMSRRILWLIVVEGFRPCEVADQVSLTEEAVRQRKSRLLRQLSEKFGHADVTTSDRHTTVIETSISKDKS